MATSSLQQKNCSQLELPLNLDLSLGGLFSLPKIPCEIIKVPKIPSEFKYNASFSSHNSITSSCSGEEQAPLLLSSLSSNKDNPMWDILPILASSSTPHMAPSSSTHIENPHQSVDCKMDGIRRHHDSVKRRKGLESSEEIREQKRARKEELSNRDYGSSSLSGSLHEANSPPIDYDEHSSLQLDGNMKGFDVDSMPCNESHQKLSDMKKAMITEVPCGVKVCRESDLHRPNQEAPISCNHRPTVSCISCVTPSCTLSSCSPTQNASSLTLITPSLLSSSAPRLETGSKNIINHMLPIKRKSSIKDEEGKSCHSSSSELENAPRSRCGSNSDILGSMGPSAAIPNASSIMYTHPFTMLPVQCPFPMPVQWGYTLPYAMHYSHMMPPLAPEINKSFISPLSSNFVPNHLPEDTSLPCIPLVPASGAGTSQSGVQTASYNEGKLQDNQETSCEEDTLTCRLALSTLPSAKNAKVQPIEVLPPAIVHKTIPRSVSDVCTSAAASSSWPLPSTSPTTNHSSEVCTSSSWPLMSSTSPTASYSNRSKSASNSSLAQEGCFKSPSKSGDAGLVGNKLCVQSQHSRSLGRKPTKTVRFSCDEREVVKSISSEDQRSSLLSKSSKICKSAEMEKSCKRQLAKKMLTSALCGRPNGGIAKRATQQREQDDGIADTQITSESSDQGESAAPSNVEGAGKLEGKNGANLPRVSTTCAGPNGKTIYGVMYITKSKQVCLICSCHGTHMSPSEFVQHSGSTVLSNPERSIIVSGFSCVKQVV